jgi:predicted nucleotidyltransferase
MAVVASTDLHQVTATLDQRAGAAFLAVFGSVCRCGEQRESQSKQGGQACSVLADSEDE